MTKSFGKPKHIDEKKIEAKAQAFADLEAALETGDETRFVALVKRLKPTATPAELVGFIETFREQRRQRSRKPSDS